MKFWKRLMCTARRRSPWLFHMNSGSCNGCDIEIVAALSPRYDAEQLGVMLQGSPRHADILCVTGPVTRKAVGAVKTVYDQVCGPKAVVAIGSCPATTNVFIDSRTLVGPLDKHVPVDVYVPGCPPRPDAIIAGVVKAATLLAERGDNPPKPEMVMVEPAEAGVPADSRGPQEAPPASWGGDRPSSAGREEVQP